MNRHQLLIGFYGEGNTDDRFFRNIIQRTFEMIGFDCKREIQVMDIVSIHLDRKRSFVKDILDVAHVGINDFGIEILCVHTDADDSNDKKVLELKIEPAKEALKKEIDARLKFVPVIPVRMTEAWMLADKNMLRLEIGTSKTNEQLGIHKMPEEYADPKGVIKEAIRSVRADESKRRRKNASIDQLYENLGSSISLDCLKKLPSFIKFEEEVRNTMRELNYL